ncbi:MAG: MarR family transcriptional regulator [Chromatiales bacterium]|nr:MarR family transcriptional regulator [Chromatiales bacterium]
MRADLSTNAPELSRQLAELALQLGRAAYGESPQHGMTPAQWAALRYFARANRFSRTVSAFAQFHATTRGTASQTIKSLVNRGLLRRTKSARDGRSVCFDLTDQAGELMVHDPFETVVRVAGRLSTELRAGTLEALSELLDGIARDRSQALPGRCALCGYLDGGDQAGTGFHCRLMQEPLATEELQQLCARFSPDEGGDGAASSDGEG